MIVVTGGTGLVGGYLLLKLAEEEGPVRVLLRPGTKPEKVLEVWKHYLPDPASLLPRFEWVHTDPLNRAALYEALQGAEYIYHCAGKVSFDRRDKRAMWETNTHLTGYIVDFCLANAVKKLAYVSSVAAVASPKGEAATEASGWPVQKKNLYAKTKTRGEFEIWRGVAEGLNAVMVNPGIILGPGNWKQSSARIFDTLYHGMSYYTTGTSAFVDNRDVADALVQLMKSDQSGERFILSSATLSYKELFESITTALGKPAPAKKLSFFLSEIAWRGEWLLSRLTGREARLTSQTARTAHKKQSYSSEKIKTSLGFRFRDIQESIRETAQCYLADH